MVPPGCDTQPLPRAWDRRERERNSTGGRGQETKDEIQFTNALVGAIGPRESVEEGSEQSALAIFNNRGPVTGRRGNEAGALLQRHIKSTPSQLSQARKSQEPRRVLHAVGYCRRTGSLRSGNGSGQARWRVSGLSQGGPASHSAIPVQGRVNKSTGPQHSHPPRCPS